MPEPDDDPRTRHFNELRWSLLRLSAAGVDQPRLFDAATPQDLAQAFDQCASTVRDLYAGDLSEAQTGALAAIAGVFETISRDGADFDAELWTAAALETSVHWANIRDLATTALGAFGWQVDATMTPSS